MNDLREKVAQEILGARGDALEVADAILAIPAIADALLLMRTAMDRYAKALRPASQAELYASMLQNASPFAQFVCKDDLPPTPLSSPQTKHS